MSDFRDELATHRPDLLRHCYRMLGSFPDAEDLVQDVLLKAWAARASYAGDAPLLHWLMRIATNACLDELARRKVRRLPTTAGAPSRGDVPIVESDAAEWITPAPDAELFPADRALELRESVALAFLALLQRVPPRQRAVLLLKDVVGMKAEEIAAALDVSVAAVSSALHRARATIAEAPPSPAHSDPPRELLGAYVRTWESHDVDALVALVRDDVEFSMPPHATWFRGRADVERFLRGPRFSVHWSAGYRVVETRANGRVALAFYRFRDGAFRQSSLQLIGVRDGAISEVISFVGPHYLRGFGLPVLHDASPACRAPRSP